MSKSIYLAALGIGLLSALSPAQTEPIPDPAPADLKGEAAPGSFTLDFGALPDDPNAESVTIGAWDLYIAAS